MSDVKPPGKRQQKARQTRQRMLDAANALFVERGYGATSLQDIADRAGVAVQTIYFTFGNKRALLKEAVDVAVAGDQEPVATMDRPWFRDALAAPTAAQHLEAHVRGAGAVLRRVAEITQAVAAAAATDPEIAGLWPDAEDPRYTVQLATAESFVTKPGARAGLAVAHVADVLYGVLSPELYLLFVRARRWKPGDWTDWALRTLRDQLCE